MKLLIVLLNWSNVITVNYYFVKTKKKTTYICRSFVQNFQFFSTLDFQLSFFLFYRDAYINKNFMILNRLMFES